jgi:hypothetical protein
MPRENVLSAGNQQGRLRDRLNPWYVCGFVDGEGSFHVAFYKDASMRTGWRAIPEFHVSQRVTSRCVLDALVKFFRCGYVKANHQKNPKDTTFVYVVRDRKDLMTNIIPFFRRHSLHTEKAEDFKLFSRIVEMMAVGEHCTKSGLKRIVTLAYRMNGSGRYRKRTLETIM